jgi:hypothetical protein
MPTTVSFDIKLDVAREEFDETFCWFQPRAAAIPGATNGGPPTVIMTLQKHLENSDFYSGLHTMRSNDLGKTWSEPKEQPALGWRASAISRRDGIRQPIGFSPSGTPCDTKTAR